MMDRKKLSLKSGLACVIAIFLFTTGCSTMDGLFKKSEADGSSQEQVVKQEQAVKQKQAVKQEQAEQITQLQSRESELEKQVRSLNSRLKAEKVARDSMARRLEIAQAAREDAIREVVRIRARLQGMASQAEASAMFAEARVILDRMEDEAFNDEALEDLVLARSYMVRGKSVLDTGNPGGAAYLFDLIPWLYEGMKKAVPRVVEVKVRIATLRESPKPSSPKIGSLYWGDSATGLEKNKDWIKVRTSSGKAGWLMKSQVR